MPYRGLVGTDIVVSANTAGSVTVANAVPAGRTVVGAIVWEASAGAIPSISNVTDTRGNSWATDVTAGAAGNTTVAVGIFRARITTALQVSDTITVTIGTSRTRWAMQYDQFDDLFTSPLDKTAVANNPGTSTSLASGATTATVQPYELVYAAFGFGVGRGPSVPAGWSGTASVETAVGSTDRALQTIYQYTSTAGVQQGSLTLTSTSTYVGAVATYKGWVAAPKPTVATRAAQRAASW